jgi:photosystem II stability/assembly factor-like uncharacterized protein
MPRRGLLLLLLASASARAQDVPAPPDVAPAAPDALPERLGERFVWELRAPLGSGARAAALAVQPLAGGAWFVADERGAVWVTEDQGATWERTLRGNGSAADDELPDAETLLLEAEALRDEALDEAPAELEVTPGEVNGTVDAELDPEVEVEGDAGEAAGIAAAELVRQRGGGEAVLPVLWVDPAAPESVFLGRADGVWRSTDSGRTWDEASRSSADDPQVTMFRRGADGVLIAGTVAGVRYSVDEGNTWIHAEDATDGARIYAITEEASSYWASTSRGLFRSANGLSWDRVALGESAEVRAVVPDPSWDNGFWVATASALHRTDDGGATFYVAGRQPLRGLRDMLHMDETGHLLAISDDGVWESMDGGVAWTTADRQLGDPDVRGVAVTDTGVVIVTPRGLWRLVAPRIVTSKSHIHEKSLSLPDSIRASVSRDEMDIDLLSLSKLGILAAFAPQLDLKFDYGASAARRTSFATLSTGDAYDGDWTIGAQLCWGGCGSTVVVEYDAVAPEIETADSMYVFDGKVFDEGEPIAAAANVAQRIRSYRRYLAEHVADAWLSRSRLVAEIPTVRTQPLREQVLHALQIQELDARLDALTNGDFTRSITRTTEESR